MKHQEVKPSKRIQTLDILRGLCIFAIVVIHIRYFNTLADLDSTTMIEGFPLPGSTLDSLTTLFISFFLEGKVFPLFSLLFGLGFYIFYQRSLEKGLQANRLFTRRLLFLGFVGFLHLLFFWNGDILFTYAVSGFFLFFFVKRKPKTLLIWATSLLLFASALNTGILALGSYAIGLGDKAKTLAGYEEMNAQAIEVFANGSFVEIFMHRLPQVFVILTNLPMVIPTVLPMFLLGLYMGKTGMLHRVDEHLKRWKTICIHSAWIGFSFSILNTAMLHGFTPLPEGMAHGIALGSRFFTGPILMLFYLSAIVLLMRKASRQQLFQPVAAVGRMSLTNYLMHTAILVTIFYGYGFGSFGQVSEFAGLFISIGIYVFQMILSTWYLKRFRQGPMESIWRKWTYRST